MTRRRSESISSTSSSSSMSSSSRGMSASLHQAKSLNSLDQSESSSSADTDRLQLPAWKRKNYKSLGNHHSTISSCESGEGSCCWSRSDGRSSSAHSLCTADSETSASSVSVSVRRHGYRQLQSAHPKQHQQRTGTDCKMLAIFSCCLDRRNQSSSRGGSRWTATPEYGKLSETCSSSSMASMSWESSNDSLNEMGHHNSYHTGSAAGRLIIKVPNQRYTHTHAHRWIILHSSFQMHILSVGVFMSNRQEKARQHTAQRLQTFCLSLKSSTCYPL